MPILPGKFLGYHHPSGEVHIEDSGEWSACPGAKILRYATRFRTMGSSVLRVSGQDNPDKRCTVGDVPDIFSGKEADHDGPYDDVIMGC